jgi:hypothetical protein
LSSMAVTSPPAPPPPARAHRHRGKLALVVLSLAVAAAAIALFAIPVTHSFSDGLNATHLYGSVTLVAPVGSRISLTWSSSGAPASIAIYDGNGHMLDSAEAATGSFSFTAMTPSDGFEANSTGIAYVVLSWSYTSPLL